MDKGWETWAAQAAELHTYRADWENRKKEGRGFYKLSKETVAAVREDLAKDYHELTEQHSEELAQLLEDFGEGPTNGGLGQATERMDRSRARNRGDNSIRAGQHA